MSSKHSSINKWGEPIYNVPFTGCTDARRFTKFIGRNYRIFSLIGCHREGLGWVVAYRTRKSSPWEGGAQ